MAEARMGVHAGQALTVEFRRPTGQPRTEHPHFVKPLKV